MRTLLVVLAFVLLPASAHAADCNTAPTWSGTGTTTVASGGSIQSAINAAPTGGTVVVSDGSYSSFTLTKNVRVIAQNRYGATVPSIPSQTAGWVEGFVISNGPVQADYASDVVFINNRILDGSGQMFESWKPNGKLTIWGNDMRDPDNDTDYGIQTYASKNTEICHNYLWGQFDQTISIKEGDVNPSIGYNTIEGGEYAGIFVGQEADNGLGPTTCNPCSVHHNWVGRSGSGFRSVGAIRIWHERGTVDVHDNVVVGGESGVEVNCAGGSFTPRTGCPDGTIKLTNNAFAGKVDGTSRMLGCVIQTYGPGSTGTYGPLQITSTGLRCWDAPLTYHLEPPFTHTGTTTGSNPQTSPAGPAPKFDPDLHLLGGSTPPPNDAPPSAVTNLKRNDAKTEADTQHLIWFTWDPATDDVGIDHYREYRDGNLVDPNVSKALSNPGAGDSIGDGSLAVCSSHTAGLEAVDTAGNIGPRTTVTMKTGGCAPPPPPPPTSEFTWAPAPITTDPFTLTRNTTCGSPPCTYDWTITLKVTDATGRTSTVTHNLSATG
jgi:hypothetical protein